MANIIYNLLRVTGPEATVERFRNAVGGTNEVLSLNQLVPMPGRLQFFGKPYDWAMQNWGTKWEASKTAIERDTNAHGGRMIAYRFQTANSSPNVWLRRAADKFPALKFELIWRDEEQAETIEPRQ